MPRERAKSHRDLDVWKKARLLTRCAYALTRELPPDERFGLVTQMRRAAISVVSNIAEGWGRGTRRQLHSFASVARGSLYEFEAQLDVTEDLGYVQAQSTIELRGLIEEVGKMLSALRTSLRHRMSALPRA